MEIEKIEKIEKIIKFSQVKSIRKCDYLCKKAIENYMQAIELFEKTW